jgi:ribosomal protein L15
MKVIIPIASEKAVAKIREAGGEVVVESSGD